MAFEWMYNSVALSLLQAFESHSLTFFSFFTLWIVSVKIACKLSLSRCYYYYLLPSPLLFWFPLICFHSLRRIFVTVRFIISFHMFSVFNLIRKRLTDYKSIEYYALSLSFSPPLSLSSFALAIRKSVKYSINIKYIHLLCIASVNG